MKITCLVCRHAYEVPEGTDVRRLACPACKAPQAANFLYERSVRFEPVDDPRYAALVEAVRAGKLDEAFYAGGYCGHGIAMPARQCGLIARRIAADTFDHPLIDRPFPPGPFYDGRPWVLSVVGAYYRFRDWIH